MRLPVPSTAESPRDGASRAPQGGAAALVTGRVRAAGPFEAIVETYHVEIHRYLWRVVSRGTDADHLVHETFLHAFRARRSLPADTPTLSGGAARRGGDRSPPGASP
jgi:Sigma-70 region 2